MKFGYNTNGMAHHRWEEGIALLAEIGYKSVAITLDHHCLDPYSPLREQEVSRMRQLLAQTDLDSVIETGSRFLLNPRIKHEPTLMSAQADGRQQRVEFLKHAVDIAAELRSEAVSFFSGIQREPITTEKSMQRLAAGCREVVDYADRRQVRLAFEPEPGMFIETSNQYEQLLDLVDAPHFGLTMDIGHLICVEDSDICAPLRRWADRIFTIHIEDMRQGIHDHLRFGEGEIDFVQVLATLVETGYTGSVNVELSRHSHMAPEVMQESYNFLQSILKKLN